WREALVQAVAGIVGMVPEGLVLLTSLNFALAALLLARRSVLVQELPAVEVLARVDTLCLDKTGTLTDGTIELVEIVPRGQLVPGSPGGAPDLYGLLQPLARARGADEPATALRPGLREPAEAHLEVLAPCASGRKGSAHSDGLHGWYFGAPDILFADGQYSEVVTEAVAQQARRGARVLALGYVPILEVPRIKDDDTDALPRNLCLAALIILRDRIRPHAARTLEYFTDQGVEVKVVSG